MFPQAEFRTIFLVPLSNYSQSECQLRVKICSLWTSFIGINKNDLSFLFASFIWVQGYNTSSSPHGSRQVCVKMMLSGFTAVLFGLFLFSSAVGMSVIFLKNFFPLFRHTKRSFRLQSSAHQNGSPVNYRVNYDLQQ